METNKNQAEHALTRGRVNLLANQQGKISTQQKDWLRQDMRQARGRQNQQIIASGIIFLIVTVVLALLPFVIIPVLFIPVLWGMAVAAWYIYVWYEQKPIRDDISAGNVNSIIGYIDKSIKHGYHITIHGVDYATPPAMYDAFSDTGRYIVYVAPTSGIVLSAEPVSETDDESNHNDIPKAPGHNDDRV